MNLSKAYALTVGTRSTFDAARHGLRPSPQGLSGLAGSVDAFQSLDRLNLFDEFLYALTGSRLPALQTYPVEEIMAQIVPGHRVWSQSPPVKRERFIAVERVDVMHDKASKELWLNLRVFADDLTRLGVTHSELLSKSGLQNLFIEVDIEPGQSDRRLLCFEQVSPRTYRSRPSDEISDLVSTVRDKLWTIVQSIPPYRKYYLYMGPSAARGPLLPQLAAVYMLMFFLSTVTRYRPQEFDQILAGQYGAFLREFLASQPKQFLYLLASEFAQREITLPAMVY